MPYKRNYKKRYSRPGYQACGKMVLGDAKKALVIASHLKRLVNVEIKNHDVKQTGITVTTTPVIIQLSNIPQGDTTVTRDGSQCKVLSLEFTANVNRHASGTVTLIRLILVCDKQTNQAVYLHSDLLADVTVGDNILSPFNLDNKFRFQVLMDVTFNLSTSVTAKKIKRSIRMSKILRFDANTSAIADLTSNSLSLVQITNETTNQPAIHMFSRLRFVDN